jgi:hypothetical protein
MPIDSYQSINAQQFLVERLKRTPAYTDTEFPESDEKCTDKYNGF